MKVKSPKQTSGSSVSEWPDIEPLVLTNLLTLADNLSQLTWQPFCPGVKITVSIMTANKRLTPLCYDINLGSLCPSILIKATNTVLCHLALSAIIRASIRRVLW